MISYLNTLKEDRVNHFFIIGHDNPDVDSIITGLLMEELCLFSGLEAKYVLFDKHISTDTYNVLKDLKITLDGRYLEETKKDDKLFLVDHYKTNHPGNVIGCLDHHPNNSNDINYSFYDNRASSACAALIYETYQQIPKLNTNRVKTWVSYAIMLDTCSLKSTKAQEREKQWIEEWSEKGIIDYKVLHEAGLCLNDLTKPINEIILNGEKRYEFYNHSGGSSYIQIAEKPSIGIMILYTNHLTKHMIKNQLEFWVFLVIDVENEKTYEYHIKNRGLKIATQSYEGIVSRGATIMPKIERYYKNKLNALQAMN